MTATPRIDREGTLRVSGGVVQEIGIASHCERCAARCPGSADSVRLMLGDDDAGDQALGRVLGSGGWVDGQPVQVSVSSAGLTRAAMVLFGLPVAFLLSGALIGAYIGGDAASVAMGYSFLFVVMGLLLRLAPSLVTWTRLRITPAAVRS